MMVKDFKGLHNHSIVARCGNVSGEGVTLFSKGWSAAFVKRIIVLIIPVLFSSIVLFWNLTGLGLSHWDEYNYIETAEWFLRKPGTAFTIYEPPGFPFVLSIFFRIFGVRDYVAIAVSGLFAVLTVAVVAYFGLRFFGAGVALTAPVMLILSPLFITYARMALTDMAFTFFFTLTMVAWYETSIEGGRWSGVVAALALAACAMTKYNGFMPVLIFAAYLLLTIRSVRPGDRTSVAVRRFRTLVLTCVPAAVLGLLFVLFLGVSTEVPTSHIFSLRTMKLVLIDAPRIFRVGVAKFETAAVLPHSGQFAFFPLAATPYYLQVLAYFVTVPVLVLALIGLFGMDVHSAPELLVGVWLSATFLLVSSVPAHYSRAILPLMPPIALAASLGLLKAGGLVQSLLTREHAELSLRPLIAALLIVVIVFSAPAAAQAVSMQHNGYRMAGQFLSTVTAGEPVLAQTQLVFTFYYPSNFGPINQTNLSRSQYLVVDFIAAENGYEPTIQQLTREGRLKLVATIPADLPPEVYLDWMGFAQLTQWNYTSIQIYKINNATTQTP